MITIHEIVNDSLERLNKVINQEFLNNIDENWKLINIQYIDKDRYYIAFLVRYDQT